jgi:hypothetical protein
MDVSTTRDQRVDTQPGGGGCLSSLFSGLGSHGSLESIVFLDFQTEGKFFRQHLNFYAPDLIKGIFLQIKGLFTG